MSGRLIAIGDVHGCLKPLQCLIDTIAPQIDDTLVMLGDYINRGPDSRGVIDLLIGLQEKCNLIPLLGNHDQMLLLNRSSRAEMPDGSPVDPMTGSERFRPEHFEFLETCRIYFETDSHFFVHANYKPALPLAEQDTETLLWLSLRDNTPSRHTSNKTAVVGHTSQKSGEVYRLPHLICIDTYCYGGGWLTAYDVDHDRFIQFDQNGERRFEET